MPLIPLKSHVKTCILENANEDYRAAKRAARYRIGKEAIYFPAFPGTHYLPYRAVTRALTRNTQLPLTGCCGKALPMTRLRLYYGAEAYQDFMFEKREMANEALDAVLAARPDLPEEREERAHSAI